MDHTPPHKSTLPTIPHPLNNVRADPPLPYPVLAIPEQTTVLK
jgi:hypothetical protein